MICICMVTLGGKDLVRLASRSIRRYVESCALWERPPVDPVDANSHGRAIDAWREETRGQIRSDDIVVIMDPDCAILSPRWVTMMEAAILRDGIGIWGAGSIQDFGPRVHASMLAVNGRLWNEIPAATFVPSTRLETRWRDTGGLYCRIAQIKGWKLRPVERGPDWNGFSAWWDGGTPLWTHLGGGTHSDPTRMTWAQRAWRWRAVRERQRFIRCVERRINETR